MLLNDLVKNVNVIECLGGKCIEVKGLCHICEEVAKGDLFFCIKGGNYDGHDFACEVYSRGACALVCERKMDLPITQIIVKDTREAMSIIASEFYGNPKDKLKLIGVTGTNGKTTTCHLIRNVLRLSGYKTGLIGTLGVFYSNVEISPALTTPDPIFLHKIFSDMLSAGVEYVVMEVSAHAMALRKLAGVRFEVGVFTNCTRDHLDYFENMQNYANTKAEFLTEKYCDVTIYNTDDDFGRDLFLTAGRKCFSFGIDNPSDVFAINVKEEISGISFVMNLFDNIYNVKCRMVGVFSVYNCLAAATCCAVLGVDFDDIVEGLMITEGVSGRVEQLKNVGNKRIFIDYAHTPDGLKSVLQALKKCVEGRLICLFGCGGNRDRDKRVTMGEISAKYADFTIVTSDNPRYEDPCDIIADIERGIRGRTDNYMAIQDRKKAISYAITKMRKEDVLLIAGKGAERFQEVMGVKHEYSDKEYIEGLFLGDSKR